MVAFVTTNAKTWAGEFHIATDLTAIGLDYGAEMQPNATLGSNIASNLPGMKSVKASLEGYINYSNSDPALFADVGVVNVPISIAPMTGAEDEAAYGFLCTVGSVGYDMTLGSVAGVSISAEASGGDSGLVRGVMGYNGTATSSANTTGAALGALSATQKMYAALHVVSVSGTNPTLDVVIQSDTVGFGSPSSRITMTQATAATSQWSSVSGAVTDTYWRVSYTIGGTNTPTFTFAVFLGIQ